MNAVTLPGGAEYGPLVLATRRLLDALATANAPDDVNRAVTAAIVTACQTLDEYAVDEVLAAHNKRTDLPSRGNPALVPFVIDRSGADEVLGTATFSRAHLGRGASAHGGTIPLLFEDVLGHLSTRDNGLTPTRCAYLHVNYRALTPLEIPLTVIARVERVEGRKVKVSGELWHGETLLADAEGLFVIPRDAGASGS